MPILSRVLTWALVLANAALIAFLIIDKPREATSKSGGRGTVLAGVILQTLSYPIAWVFRRPRIDPFPAGGSSGPRTWVEIFIAVLSVACAYASVVFFARVKKHLGKQWALSARVVDGHELITDGPYCRVRHPIYLAMFGLLASALIGVSSPIGAIFALAAFIPGSALRIRAEDALLGETFGAEFEEYRKRVPAFFPKP